MLRSGSSIALLLAAALAGASCAKTEEPPPGASPPRAAESGTGKAPDKPAPPRPAPRPAADLAWDAPASWTKAENPSPMRKATYKIPRAAGDSEDGELAVSSAGGSVEMNIARWKGQFEKAPEPVITKKQVGDLKVTEVELRGTFSGGGMPGGPPSDPKIGFAMLAAIVETPGGLFFFKATGPEKTLKAAKPDFEKFLDTLRLK